MFCADPSQHLSMQLFFIYLGPVALRTALGIFLSAGKTLAGCKCCKLNKYLNAMLSKYLSRYSTESHLLSAQITRSEV